MFLRSLASAFPSFSLTQNEVLEAFLRNPLTAGLQPESRTLLKKVLSGDSGITQRHFAIDDVDEVFQRDAESLNRVFEKEAPALGTEALTKALNASSLVPADLDAIFVCTCTGYLCPGVSSHIGEQLGLRPEAVLQDVVGLGCGAALPAMRTASDYLTAHPKARVAVVAVEICSAAFYIDDDPGVLISLCLFGDGASASIWQSDPDETTRWRASGFRSLHQPGEREKIRFLNAGGKLRNQLHRSVPSLAARAVEKLFQQEDQERIIVAHPGGRDVLNAIARRCPDTPLTSSRRILNQYGNLSSPSVLVALEAEFQNEPARDLFLTSFGAGFSCHSCLLTRA
ncbi:MAG: stilbene synthase [Verrucomicrobiota bacterium]